MVIRPLFGRGEVVGLKGKKDVGILAADYSQAG